MKSSVLNFIPIQFTLFLVSGILFQYFFNLEVNYILLFLFISSCSLILLYFKTLKDFLPKLHFNFATYITFFFIGILAMYLHTDVNYQKHYSNFLNKKNKTVLTIIDELKDDNYNQKYIANVDNLNEKLVFGKVLINLKKDSLKTLNIGDKIFTNITFLEIQEPKNPYQFDYKKYLEKQQISHQLYFDKNTFIIISKGDFSFTLLAQKFRKKINNLLIKNGFSGDELGVINALILGQRQNISDELLENYVGAGAIHILAISGLHIGIILLILNFLLSPIERLKNGKFFKLILVVTLLWIYAFIAGLSPSVVRAVTMFTAVAIGMQFNRPTNVYNTLVMSIFVLLLFNPYYVFEVGFQLSYLAVFAIVWVQPLLYNIFSIKYKFLDFFWKIFTVSLAAQIGVLPLSLFYFHQFPSLFFISNILIIPVLGIILGGGLLIIFLSLLDVLPSFLVTAYNWLIHFMNSVVEWVAHQESFLFKNISFSLLLVFASYLLIVFLVQFLKKKNVVNFICFLVSVVVFQLVFIDKKYEMSIEDELVIFHKNRHSILSIKKGNQIQTFHDLDSASLNKDKLLTQYNVGIGTQNIKIDSIGNIYEFNNQKILLIDNFGIYQIKNLNPEIIILRQSPKINLTRLIENLNPKIIIADGSNYKSYVNRWEQTCKQKNTPFHSTLQKGAYILKE